MIEEHNNNNNIRYSIHVFVFIVFKTFPGGHPGIPGGQTPGTGIGNCSTDIFASWWCFGGGIGSVGKRGSKWPDLDSV